MNQSGSWPQIIGLTMLILFITGCLAVSSGISLPPTPLAIPRQAASPPGSWLTDTPTQAPSPPPSSNPDAKAGSTGAQIDITARPSTAGIGELIILTGSPINVGLPQYILYLGGEPAVVIRYDEPPLLQRLTGAEVELVSALAGQSEVEFVLRAARPGQVDAAIGVSGGVRLDPGPDSMPVWAWGSAVSPSISLTVTAASP